MSERLQLHTSPHLAPELSTPRLMADVNIALIPVVLASIYFFGISAILVISASVAGAMLTEWRLTAERPRGAALCDNSALLTGVLLGLTLPPGLPLWMAFVGGVVSISLGKTIWGGMGHNLFNPALVGRAFLQAAFPVPLTSWVPQGTGFLDIHSSTFAMPLMRGTLDGVSAATPLASMKFENEVPEFLGLLSGNTSGAIGETSALLIMLCGAWLLYRRAFDWRIPFSILTTAFLLSGVLHLIWPQTSPAPWNMILSGGMLLGAIFMATDPVSSPLAPKAAWIFGAGIGVLVILIRLYGGLPEGMMYSILLMNAATPLIERSMQPRVFGRGKAV